MSTPLNNGKASWNDWAEEVILLQEQEELERSQAEVHLVMDEGMATEGATSVMKDSVLPSNSRTYQSEQALPARAESEPSVPPSGPCELASLDGIGKEKQLKKGRKNAYCG